MYSISNYRFSYKSYEKYIGFLFFFFSLFCHAASPEQLEQIQKAAEAHVNSMIQVPSDGELVTKAAHLDSRIKASNCPVPLETSSPSKSNSTSNVTVLVRCPSDQWRIYVPVKISVSMPLVTVNRSFSRGEQIQAHDLQLKMIRLNAYRRQGFTATSQVVGARMKKNLRAGEVVERDDVCVVCKSDKVIIKAVKNGMTISTKGTALTDGASGEQIRVINDKSKRIVEGVVSGISEITVYF